MKIAIIGAAGVRTPLLVESIIHRQNKLGLDELALMDIDGDRLEMVGWLTSQIEKSGDVKFKIMRTTSSEEALVRANFVITTFRVGGIASRVIDERVPLNFSLLGQETTGAGGFAMGIRSIPVLLDYVKQMQKLCPDAWLINFANPSGMLTEALHRAGGWDRSVGICDAPVEMQRAAAVLLDASHEDIELDYFGLNHLGWVRAVNYGGVDCLPQIIGMIKKTGKLPGFRFDPEFISALGMIPNEYNYYYYYRRQAVRSILDAGQTRGEQILEMNTSLFTRLDELNEQGDTEEMLVEYRRYLSERSSSYMKDGDGIQEDNIPASLKRKLQEGHSGEGYAGVALDLIEGLLGIEPSKKMIVNVPNNGAIPGMEELDVVEAPVTVSKGSIQIVQTSEVPSHALGLMKKVKAYERLVVEAAVEKSYSKALLALTLHPLVSDYHLAHRILNDYCNKHGSYFPELM
jgi:6-phospho-beta-glucosidase